MERDRVVCAGNEVRFPRQQQCRQKNEERFARRRHVSAHVLVSRVLHSILVPCIESKIAVVLCAVGLMSDGNRKDPSILMVLMKIHTPE